MQHLALLPSICQQSHQSRISPNYSSSLLLAGLFNLIKVNLNIQLLLYIYMKSKNSRYSSESSDEDELWQESFDIVSQVQSSSHKQSKSYTHSSYQSSEKKQEESLGQLIKQKRLKLCSGLKEFEQNDATFDLSDTLHDTKHEIRQHHAESTLESRIKKLEQELNSSLKSTQQKKHVRPHSPSITSVDSFSIDAGNRRQKYEELPNYERRLLELRNPSSSKREPEIDWKRSRKLENFDHEIQTLQEELDKLKEEIDQDDQHQRRKKQKLKEQLKQTTECSESEEEQSEYAKKQKGFKKPRKPAEKIRVEQDLEPILDQIHKLGNQPDEGEPRQATNQYLPNFPQSTIEQVKQTEVSLDVVPQKQRKGELREEEQKEKEKENKKPQSQSQIPSDISRMYKLNKEVEVLKQIEKIRNKLKKSIKSKIQDERVVEQSDLSYNMPSKTRLVNKSTKQHCPNCTYLLNKGMSTALCSCG